ncbi:hypothetical protein [Mycolicibacterium conceptionense]|uniref:hypothetical protein n=1 Tax=Mycolicibacterium conceptionense TaxID=451644 RepID=UPI0007EC4E9D|nr:hypothetical protein [Mycolicibacterium conceptionense]OBJ92162.1 hypothetical protein A5639_08775 [Mycolicibacterium conceptionense]
MNDTTIQYLQDAEKALLAARGSVNSARAETTGARSTRCAQLVDQIEASLAWAQRIRFYLEADQVAAR